jgi:hypothetical protein
MLYFAGVKPISRRQQVIFLIVFAVPIFNLLFLGAIYHTPCSRVRRSTAVPRPPMTRIAVQLYSAFALIALVNVRIEGWHWSVLLYLIFPTVGCALMFWSNRGTQKSKSGQSEG